MELVMTTRAEKALHQCANRAAHRAGGKCYECEVMIVDQWQPLGGATTWAERDAYFEALEVEFQVDDLTYDFDAMLENIQGDESLTAVEKATRIAAVSAEFGERVAAVEPDGSLTGERAVHAPQLAGTFQAYKDAETGEYRWLAIYSNNFQDREGEVFTEDAHQTYVKTVDGTGRYPTLRLWHTPPDIGVADCIDYSDGFMVASGVFAKDYQQAAESLSGEAGLACSHGYLYDAKDLVDGAYQRYFTTEITVLPGERAANPLTAFAVEGEFPMLNPEKREFMSKHLGEPAVAAVEAQLTSLKARAEQAGLSYKEITLADVMRHVKDDAAPATAEPEVEAPPPSGSATTTAAADAAPSTTDASAPADATPSTTDAVEPEAAPAAESSDASEPPAAGSAVDAFVGDVAAVVAEETGTEPEAAAPAAEGGDEDDADAEGAPGDDDGEKATPAGASLQAAVSAALQPLIERVDALDAQVKDLNAEVHYEATDRVADIIRPHIGPTANGYRASRDAEPTTPQEQANAAAIKAQAEKDDAEADDGPADPFVKQLGGLFAMGVGAGAE